MEVSQEETNWSVDIKRSILAMLQLTIKPEITSIVKELKFNNLDITNSTTFDRLEVSRRHNAWEV